MANHVIPLRLPASVDTALRGSAVQSKMTVPKTLECLLRYSFGNAELLRGLPDCGSQGYLKLDARIPAQTFDQLKYASQKLGISTSVYTRTILYHFFITKRLFQVKSDGRYTLAVRHD